MRIVTTLQNMVFVFAPDRKASSSHVVSSGDAVVVGACVVVAEAVGDDVVGTEVVGVCVVGDSVVVV